MMKGEERREEILAVAEAHMRSGGYDAISFREIAAAIGIKSASVHYHFPQKRDLGAAVVRRYAERLQAFLGAPDDPAETPADRLKRLCDGYAHALFEEELNCLCCVLGAESRDLPSPVAEAVARFFTDLLNWTERALEGAAAPRPPEAIAALQGAMVLATATRRPELFRETAEALQAALADQEPRRSGTPH